MRKKPCKRGGCKIGLILGAVAFFGALLCLSFFSVKFLVFALAVLLIVLGVFLIRL